MRHSAPAATSLRFTVDGALRSTEDPSVAAHPPLPSKTPSSLSAAEDDGPRSPVESLLGELQSALAAKQRDALAGVRNVRLALANYERALEERLVAQFARDHALRAPSAAGPSVEVAADRLCRAVLALPEVASVAPANAASAAAPSSHAFPKANEPLGPTGEPTPASARPEAEGGTSSLPWLENLSIERKLVIVGALAGRQKLGALPESLEGRTEWVDTESDGAHAIGNLPQRIRQGRVAAVVILDRAVQHKHTEPLVAAARAHGVPVGFAGKGGILSIRRALERIDEQLKSR